MPITERHIQRIAEVLDQPLETTPIYEEGETRHPITGGHPLSWPPNPDFFRLPVPRVRATLLRKSGLQTLFINAAMDVRGDRLWYNPRMELPFGIALGGTEGGHLSDIVNVEVVDLPATEEFMGLAKIIVRLREDTIEMILDPRGCVWPENLRRPREKVFRGTIAVSQSLTDYGIIARKGFDTFAQEFGLTDFYNDWNFIARRLPVLAQRPDREAWVSRFYQHYQDEGILL